MVAQQIDYCEYFYNGIIVNYVNVYSRYGFRWNTTSNISKFNFPNGVEIFPGVRVSRNPFTRKVCTSRRGCVMMYWFPQTISWGTYKQCDLVRNKVLVSNSHWLQSVAFDNVNYYVRWCAPHFGGLIQRSNTIFLNNRSLKHQNFLAAYRRPV